MAEIGYKPPSGILVANQGTVLGRFIELNFTGAGVTASASGSTAVVAIPGGGGTGGYVDGGNAFGANATIGLNDAFQLTIMTNGMPAIEILPNQTMIFTSDILDLSSVQALSVDGRNATDISGNFSIDWGNRLFYDNSGSVVSQDYGNNLLQDQIGTESMNYNLRNLFDSIPLLSIDYGRRVMYDDSANESIDYSSRILFDSSSASKFEWNTTGIGFFATSPAPQYSTENTFTGWTRVGILQMGPQDTMTGSVGTSAYTVGDIVLCLKTYGLMAL